MRVAERSEHLAVTCLTRERIAALAAMHAGGSSLEAILLYLRGLDIPLPAASVGLVQAGIIPKLREARQAVDSSDAYASWPEPLLDKGAAPGKNVPAAA